MSSKTPPAIILGTHTVGDPVAIPGIVHFNTREQVLALLDAFQRRGYTHLDTASNYPGSELRLGEAGAASRFTIHSKIRSWGAGDLEPAKVKASLDQSLADLKTSSVETMFLHLPDRQTPLEGTVKAMHDGFQQGKFEKFGLSNYSAAEVSQIIEICEKHGYTKPSVYQGHYNALVRGGEKELFPLLRKHNIAFFGFSPAAGGFFSKGTNNSASTRWSDDNPVGKLYSSLYSHPDVQASVKTFKDAAAKHGISGHAAALRWTTFHSILDGSCGDGVIFTVSKMEQLDDTIQAFEAGPLPDDLAEAISSIYTTVEGREPPYHM